MRQAVRKRWYDDACGTAFALEMIGERWTILIMRELMFGPRRFSELRSDLPGISAKILAQRLEAMEERSIVRKRRLPPPASAQVYELTPWGMEAENLVQMMGSWATRHPDHDPSLPLSAASIMMSFKTMFDSEAAGDLVCRIGFRLGEHQFCLTISEGTIDVVRQPPEEREQDVVFTGEPTALAACIYGGQPLDDMVAAGMIALQGDPGVFRRFASLFPLPPKIDLATGQ
ncbi:MAG: winged helix-turn-helix transcriptional regulator [Blastomonas sp.]